jgi:xanthine dehydrogenase accessory factor
MFDKFTIAIIGAGDTGTAAAIRCFKCGFRPILIERKHPTDLHFFKNFSDVVYLGEKIVEEIRCRLISESPDTENLQNEIQLSQRNREIPMLSGDLTSILSAINPEIIVDSRLKLQSGEEWSWNDFPCVVKIGSEFKVGTDGHFVIGAAGKELGRTIRTPQDLTSELPVNNHISLAPLEGVFINNNEIGDRVKEREEVGRIDDIPILSPLNGIISGILHSGHFVNRQQPLFEIVPHSVKVNVERQASTESLAIAGGIIEAILTHISEK